MINLVRNRRAVYLLVAVVACICVARGAFTFALSCIRPPGALIQSAPESIVLTDRNGVPLRERRVEERFSHELSRSEIPDQFVRAILGAEDKRFFRHHGVDWLATGRALVTGIYRGRVVSGASTITQQLIKIAEHRRRNWRTKVVQTVEALALERRWSKDEIFTAYVNRLDFGNLNIGLASAADFYFAKSPSELSDAEAAFLAGLPKNPRRLNPHMSPGLAHRRQQTVLRRMRDMGSLSAGQYGVAAAELLRIRPPGRLFRAPHFADLVLRDMPPDATRVRTTLDLELTERITAFVRERLSQLRDHNARNAAAVVIDNRSGDVLALVGSENYFASGTGQVNGAWTARSAGSTLKPFTYLLALERGQTPASVVADVPTRFDASSGFYAPENYNRRCYGPVRYRTALANSLNICAVKVLLAAGGPTALYDRLRLCGLTTLTREPEVYGLGLTLGNGEARLLELTNAYAALARLGEYRPFRIRTDQPNQSTRITQPEFAWQIADMLSDNSARSLAFGINSSLRFPYPVACKTGTSTDFRDNWTIGYTPEFTAGVWVGNFDGSPMHDVSGVTGAGPIFHDIFDYLHQTRGTGWYEVPGNIVGRLVHPLTGKLLGKNDPRGAMEYFLSDHLPPPERPEDYNSDGTVSLPPEYADWLATGENDLEGRAHLGDRIPLRITSPVAGTSFLIDPDVPSSRRIMLTTAGGVPVDWRSDSLHIHDDNGACYAEADEGEHHLFATDRKTGQRAETWIRVRSL